MVFNILKSISEFEKSCSIIEESNVIIPSEITQKYPAHLNLKDTSLVLTETLDYYNLAYNNLITKIDSFEFIDPLLTFYEYYTQVRTQVSNLNATTSIRVRFIGSLIEDSTRLNLKTDDLIPFNYELLKSLYQCFFNISLISNRLSINTILDIQSISLERDGSEFLVKDSELNSFNLKIAFDYLRQKSKERYQNGHYIELFYSTLSKSGLSKNEFDSKLSFLFTKEKDGKLPLIQFKKYLNELGANFKDLIEGLLLDGQSVDTLVNRIQKPYKTQRYLTYPLPILNVNDEDFVMLDKGAFIHAISYNIGDYLNYGKIPEKWKNLFSNETISTFNQGSDFEDKIETLLSEKKNLYLVDSTSKCNFWIKQ